jgi:hypothetical protein
MVRLHVEDHGIKHWIRERNQRKKDEDWKRKDQRSNFKPLNEKYKGKK